MEWFRFKKYVMGFSFCMMTLTVQAAVLHPYLGGSLGNSYASIDNTLTRISYVSGVTITDAYPASTRNVSAAVVSLNGGYEITEANHWMPAIAAGVGFYNSLVGYDFSGTVVETVTGMAPSTLYNYTYNVYNTRLMAETQFSWMLGSVMPFIQVGVGAGWNRTNGYTETPLTTDGFAAQPPFQSQTNCNFAYQAGVGVSTAIQQERLSLGYRYVNLGHTSLGTRGETYPFSMTSGSLYTNEIYLSYTHIF